MKINRILIVCLWLVGVVPLLAHAQVRYRGVTVGGNLTEADIDDLAQWKPNLVRYQMEWTKSADTATEEEYNVWLADSLAKLDLLLPIFEKYGIKVALDLHTPPGGFVPGERKPLHRVFYESWAKDALVRVWREMATRYAANTTIWGYDILNEPAEAKVSPGLKKWNDLALEVGQAIREIDTVHPIIIGCVYGDRIERLKAIPLDNVVYTFHMYFPWAFLHQGLYGRPLGVSYPSKGNNKAALKKRLGRVVSFQKKTKAPIYIGEFTSIRWAPGKSSIKYLRDVIKLFEANKWHWTYHAYREADAWSAEHGSNPKVHDKSPTLTDRAKLLISYFAKN